MVYYPIVHQSDPAPGEKTDELKESVIVEDNGKKHYVLMKAQSDVKNYLSGESITKNKEHRHLEARYVDNILHFVTDGEHMKQVFFSKLDFDLNALVISIRGTQSVTDVLTNFTAEPTPLKIHKHYADENGRLIESEDTVEGVIHYGKLGAAIWILAQNKKIINELFFFDENEENLSDYQKKIRKIDTIYCVGHSLGGAVATILGIQLREYMRANIEKLQGRKLPNIRVVTYGPSAFISYNLSRWCRSFVDSYVVGGDLVPRFSVGQAEKLRLEIKNSNWKDKAEQYLKQHNWVGSFVDSVNNFLIGKGMNPVIDLATNKTDDKPKTVGRELNNVTTNKDGNMTVEETVTTSVDDTVQTETISYQIETLYPAGNLYLFVEEEEQGVKRHKRFASLLINFMDQKLSDDLPEPDQSPVTTSKLIKSWWNSPNPERTLVPLSDEDANEYKKRKFVVRYVDAKTFDRIILSSSLFRDHWCYNFYDTFEFMLEQYGETPTKPISRQSSALDAMAVKQDLTIEVPKAAISKLI
jgi:hypothetical protein